MNDEEEVRVEAAPPGSGEFSHPDYVLQLIDILQDSSLSRSEKRGLLNDYHANDIA